MSQREAGEVIRARAAETREARLEEQREARRIHRTYGDTPLGAVYQTHGDTWMDDEQRDWEEGREDG